jgi:hypothetical protein
MRRMITPGSRTKMGKRGWILAMVGLFFAGCVPKVVYTPSHLVSEKPVLPLRALVRPFKDATDEVPRGTKFIIPAVFLKTKDYMNITRPLGDSPAILPPELWAKSFASEIRHQGVLAEVQYGAAPEGGTPDVLIEGFVQKAEVEVRAVLIVIFPVYISGRQDYAFTVRALRPGDRKVLWSGKVERSIPKGLPSSGEPIAAVLQSMMVEASQNLVKGLQAASAELQIRPEPSQANVSAGDSVEDILKKINGR